VVAGFSPFSARFLPATFGLNRSMNNASALHTTETTPEHEQRGFTDVEAARRLGVSVATVRRWRLTGAGPVFRKFGGCVRYFNSDIEQFINASPSGGGQKQAQ
jgi:predicted DNA-binding transcriptional regulator AlpA